MLDPDADSAKGLMIAAIIVQVLFVVIWLFALVVFLFFFVATPMTPAPTVTTPTVVFPFFSFTLFFTSFLIVGILWIILDFFLIYQRLSDNRVAEAETPALVLGILQIIAGGVVPGILVIIAYIKIRDSLRNARYRYQQQYPFQQQPPGY